ncbi:MAG TPA: ABC transporter substrate-binding protein, partial [Rhodopila sp.]
GMNVEIQEMDWNTLAQRRTKADPIDKGGWSIFHNWWLGTSIANPAISTVVRGLGAKGWAGWYSNEKIEALTADWTHASTDEARHSLARSIHQEAMNSVPTVVLGRFFILTAHRKGLRGLLQGTSPYPWNLSWT